MDIKQPLLSPVTRRHAMQDYDVPKVARSWLSPLQILNTNNNTTLRRARDCPREYEGKTERLAQNYADRIILLIAYPKKPGERDWRRRTSH